MQVSVAFECGAFMGKKKKKITLAQLGPGREGRVEEGERIIDDPYQKGRKVTVTANVRESAIDHMASRGRLDATQVAAADRFRKMWELAAIGRQKGVDLDNVGGGSGVPNDPLTDALVRASRALNTALRELGPVHSKILIDIVGEGKLIETVATNWAKAGGIVKGKRAEGYITGTLVDAVNRLVEVWRLEGAPQLKINAGRYFLAETNKRERTEVIVKDDIRATGPISYTGPVREIAVGKFGDVEEVYRRGVDRGALTTHASGNVGASARGRPKKR